MFQNIIVWKYCIHFSPIKPRIPIIILFFVWLQPLDLEIFEKSANEF